MTKLIDDFRNFTKAAKNPVKAQTTFVKYLLSQEQIHRNIRRQCGLLFARQTKTAAFPFDSLFKTSSATAHC
jgi:hypothetical protein